MNNRRKIKLKNALISHMREHNLTQAQVAKKLGISQSSISRIIHGDWVRTNDHIKKVANSLDVNINSKIDLSRPSTGIIENAINNSWDGSNTQARQIVKAIKLVCEH